MVKNTQKYKVLIFLFLYLFFNPIFAQNFRLAKKVRKSYYCNNSKVVDIANKYGKINIETWNKDSVKIDINVVVKSKDSIQLRNIYNNIDFEFNSTSNSLSIKTLIGTNPANAISNLKHIAATILTSGNNVQIDYLVKIPHKCAIKLNNKYGDVVCADFFGAFSLILSNGNFQAGNLSGNSDIVVKFGKSTISDLRTGRLDIDYGECQLKKAGNLKLTSKFSKINIEYAEQLSVQSKRDKIYISTVERLFCQSFFSDFWISDLNNELNIDSKFGTLNFISLAQNFSFINIIARNCDVNLFLRNDHSFLSDITYKRTEINFPDKINSLQKKQMPADKEQFVVFGTIGKPLNNAKIRINTESGSLNIYSK